MYIKLGQGILPGEHFSIFFFVKNVFDFIVK